MFPLSPTMWIYAGVGLLIVALGAGVKIQTSRLDAVKQEYAGYKAQVKAAGDAQNAASKLKDEQNKLEKEKADAQNSKARRDLAALYDAYGKLRDSRPGGSLLPQAAPGTASPAVASFDRAALDSALSGFDRGITSILGEGDQAIVDLNTAKRWAKP